MNVMAVEKFKDLPLEAKLEHLKISKEKLVLIESLAQKLEKEKQEEHMVADGDVIPLLHVSEYFVGLAATNRLIHRPSLSLLKPSYFIIKPEPRGIGHRVA